MYVFLVSTNFSIITGVPMPPGGGQMPMTSSGSQTGYNGPQQSMSGYPRPQMNQQINQMPQGKGRAGIFLKTSKR